MTSQPPLIDGTGASLPGPDFVPLPGWGGRLQRWIRDHVYTIVFRIALTAAFIVLVNALWHSASRTASLSPVPTAIQHPTTSITVTASHGDGMTTLAARAVDLYIAMESRIIRLDSAQHLVAVDALAHSVCWCPLTVGQSVSFAKSSIASSVDAALRLSPAQHAAWSRLLRK